MIEDSEEPWGELMHEKSTIHVSKMHLEKQSENRIDIDLNPKQTQKKELKQQQEYILRTKREDYHTTLPGEGYRRALCQDMW
ncbi:hypothetical protein CDAR_509681 [Caerostris darwini]|uniref:Uncharacterized protein n=1 Tax=Caerostris darwini TaxID=1538125 RepID=A0AAV4SCE9_9ARAC|nr:hypothetical protein CDAR_509681 [Caerostris darwini]